MTSDFYVNLSTKNAEKIGDSSYKWNLTLPIKLEENARFECGLVRAVIPSTYRFHIAPPASIRYKMAHNDVKEITLERTQFDNLDALTEFLNALINKEISKQVSPDDETPKQASPEPEIFKRATLDDEIATNSRDLLSDEIFKYVVLRASNSRVHLQVNEPIEYIEFTPSFSHFLGFENMTRFVKGNHASSSPFRMTMFSNQLSMYTDFTVGRICDTGFAPLLASFVLPFTGQYLETIAINHIEYMGLTRLDLRNITITINHTYENEPFVWYNPMNHYLSFTLHFRRAYTLFDV